MESCWRLMRPRRTRPRNLVTGPPWGLISHYSPRTREITRRHNGDLAAHVAAQKEGAALRRGGQLRSALGGRGRADGFGAAHRYTAEIFLMAFYNLVDGRRPRRVPSSGCLTCKMNLLHDQDGNAVYFDSDPPTSPYCKFIFDTVSYFLLIWGAIPPPTTIWP